MTNLLLASASPRRHELLALLGLPYKIVSPDVAEDPQAEEAPDALARRLSRAKARSAGRADPEAVIVACDTVVALEDRLLGKPQDRNEAMAMLQSLRGRCHSVYSAITLLHDSADRMLTDVVETRVKMRDYSDAEIATYVVSGDPLDKAGAYAIQNPGFHPVAEISGCYTNVVGLPLCHLTRRLRAWEVELSNNVPSACCAHTGHQCTIYTTILNDKQPEIK